MSNKVMQLTQVSSESLLGITEETTCYVHWKLGASVFAMEVNAWPPDLAGRVQGSMYTALAAPAVTCLVTSITEFLNSSLAPLSLLI